MGRCWIMREKASSSHCLGHDMRAARLRYEQSQQAARGRALTWGYDLRKTVNARAPRCNCDRLAEALLIRRAGTVDVMVMLEAINALMTLLGNPPAG